jgi:hypothetical protein
LSACADGPEAWESLGATPTPRGILLPALDRTLRVDLERREVFVDQRGGEVSGRARSAWGVLALHYLCARDRATDARRVSFAHFSDSRGYLSVFGKRIVDRFLATTGRTAAPFEQSSERLGGRRLDAPGVGYVFDLFPRLPISLIRHEGDDEIGPGAVVLYRADAERLLPAEDRVVAAELLLDALQGKPMTEGGAYRERRN